MSGKADECLEKLANVRKSWRMFKKAGECSGKVDECLEKVGECPGKSANVRESRRMLEKVDECVSKVDECIYSRRMYQHSANDDEC